MFLVYCVFSVNVAFYLICFRRYFLCRYPVEGTDIRWLFIVLFLFFHVNFAVLYLLLDFTFGG